MLGAEALITKEVRNTHKLLIDHINALRQIPELANMRAVMALESNLAFESQHILHAMTTAGMKMWVAMGEGRGGELGFLTTNERKEEMCLLLREAMKCFRISIHKQFVSLSMGAEKGKTRLRDELSNYCVINDVPKSAFGKVRNTTQL